MIQRVQTIFLALATGISFGLFGFPLATTPQAQSSSTLFANAAYQLNDHWGLMLAFGLAGLSTLASIFLFKNRGLQIRLTRLGTIALIVGSGLAVSLLLFDQAASQAQWSAFWAMPVIALACTILAVRYIRKDDQLVKSMDRLR